MDINKRINLVPFKGNTNQSKELQLASSMTERFLNLYINSLHGTGKSACACIQASEAMQLRDILLEIYPVAEADAVEDDSMELEPARIRVAFPNGTEVIFEGRADIDFDGETIVVESM
jgi:hypothetical protein